MAQSERLLLPGNPHENRARAVFFDHKRDAGPQAQAFEIAKRGGVLVIDAADSGGGAGRPFEERSFIRKRARGVLVRDQMTVWVDLRIAQNGGDAILETL